MIKTLILQFIPPISYIVITSVIGILSYHTKKYLASKHEMIMYEKQQLIKRIGIENYNKDVKIAKNIIYSIEQIGKEFNWEGTIKHAKATELIALKTSLSKEEIYTLIKATVALFSS